MSSAPKPIIAAIVAVSKNGVIGRKGDLPWHVPEDLKYFRDTTRGSPVIMGRKTLDSLNGVPLPGRKNIIITRQKGYSPPGVTVVGTLDEAIAIASQEKLPRGEIFILGGGEIYQLAMSITDRIYLTEIDVNVNDGDARFPGWPGALPQGFRETSRRESSQGGLTYRFLVFDREGR